MKVSIVMPYFNRKALLEATLVAVATQTKMSSEDYEFIIVDDGSDDPSQLITQEYLEPLPGKVIVIPPEEKRWYSPVIALNRAWRASSGDRIIIQSPECLHVGDILTDCLKMPQGEYWSYGAYNCNIPLTGIPYLDTEYIMAAISPMVDGPCVSDYGNGWYNHTVHRPLGFHFCSVIHRADMEDLNGFDERYAYGCAFDDNEFLERIRRKGLQLKIIDSPFVIHQEHFKIAYNRPSFGEAVERNRHIWKNVTLMETTWRVNV